MTEGKNEVARKPMRLPGFDYSAAGWYFITICSQGRRCLFGAVRDGSVLLSRAGAVVRDEWLRSLDLRPGLAFDQWVIMPNHLHAIVVLQAADNDGPVTRAHSCAPLQRRSRSLSSFVAQFKASVTKRVRLERLPGYRQVWQRGYHDHIVRSQRALDALREYIQYNPLKWELDKYNPKRKSSSAHDEADSIAEADRQILNP